MQNKIILTLLIFTSSRSFAGPGMSTIFSDNIDALTASAVADKTSQILDLVDAETDVTKKIALSVDAKTKINQYIGDYLKPNKEAKENLLDSLFESRTVFIALSTLTKVNFDNCNKSLEYLDSSASTSKDYKEYTPLMERTKKIIEPLCKEALAKAQP